MGFFKEIKEDFAQAVNELLPGADEPLEDDELVVKTLEDELDTEAEMTKLDGLLETVEEPDVAPVQKTTEIVEEPLATEENSIEGTEVEISEESPEEVTEELIEEPIEEPLEEPVEKPIEEPVEEPIEEPIEESIEESLEELVEESEVEVEEISIEEVIEENELNDEFIVDTIEEQVIEVIQENEDIKAEEPNNNAMMEGNEMSEELKLEEELLNETESAVEIDTIDDASDEKEIADEVTVITEGTSINGDIHAKGSVDIQGKIVGSVACNGKLVVTGVLEGNSESSEFFADAAHVEGEVTSSGTVKIGIGSVVIGNITATSAVIAGAIKGDIDVHGPVVVDTSAVVMGNIKSRSVQINNGAVIEGFCSQCYADIDVKGLFDTKKGN